MPTATVTFRKLLQNSQDLGGDDEHMVPRVFFDMEFVGRTFRELHADIKQPVGSSFENAALEVSAPANYSGPFNHAEFRAAAEDYYRSLIGSSGRGINVSGNSSVRMINNLFVQDHIVEFLIELPNGRKPW